MLRLLLADTVADRVESLRKMSADQNYSVEDVLSSTDDIAAAACALKPDVVLVGAPADASKSIEHIRQLMQQHPCPVVLYAGSRDAATISRAVDAGVGAYVTEVITAEDLDRVIEIATARFRKFAAMTSELQQARDQLAERKLVDKAKALIMKQHKLDEAAAHHTIQQMAMNQRKSLRDAAKAVIAMFESLPGGT